MWARTIYCPVCGVPFAAWHVEFNPVPGPDVDEEDLEMFKIYYDPDILKKDDTDWMDSFRVLAQRSKIPEDTKLPEPCSRVYPYEKSDAPDDDIVPSELASLDNFTEICFPPRYNTQYLTFEGEKVPREYFLLPIHDCCLKIAENVCMSKGVSMAQFYNAVLRQREVDIARELRGLPLNYGTEGGIDWPHGYYGAAQFWGTGWSCELGWEWLCAYPLVDSSTYLRKIISEDQKCIEDDALASPIRDLSLDRPSRNKELSPLERLPDLALTSLAKELSVSEALKLQRVSRTMYQRLPLIPKFWRDRLISGELAPYVWEFQSGDSLLLKQDLDKDWYTFAKKWHSLGTSFDTVSENHGEPIGLKNRRRLWTIASRTVSPLEN